MSNDDLFNLGLDDYYRSLEDGYSFKPCNYDNYEYQAELKAETDEWIYENAVKLSNYFVGLRNRLFGAEEIGHLAGQKCLDDGIEMLEGEIIDV